MNLTDQEIDVIAFRILNNREAFPTMRRVVPLGTELQPFSRELVRLAFKIRDEKVHDTSWKAWDEAVQFKDKNEASSGSSE